MAKVSVKVGDTFKQRCYGECEVIEYNSCENVIVRFVSTGYETKTAVSSLRKGLVKDYLKPTVFGVGFNSYGKLPIKGKDIVIDKARVKWKDMMTRCYGNKNNKSYKNCEVSKEWHDFKVFLDWYRGKIVNEDYLNYHLDKDLKILGNRVYSDKTCLLIPRKINNLLYKVKKKGKDTCIGVWKTPSGSFQAYTNDENGNRVKLGEHQTEKEAFDAVKIKKEEVMNKVILKYKGILEDEVINLLLKIRVCKNRGYYSS